MRVREVDADVAVQLDLLFEHRLLLAIDYCDQSEAPPMTALQTHALSFSFHHTAPGHDDTHLYKGLLVYSPPLSSLSLGTFNGTGCLVAHPGQSPDVFQELGTSRGPSPWVRIAIGMHRSALADPETGEHRVSIVASFTFLNDGGGLVGPGGVDRYLEADIDLKPARGAVHEGGHPFMVLKDTAEGDQGRIQFTMSTVVP